MHCGIVHESPALRNTSSTPAILLCLGDMDLHIILSDLDWRLRRGHAPLRQLAELLHEDEGQDGVRASPHQHIHLAIRGIGDGIPSRVG